MEEFKIDYFKERNASKEFPEFEDLSDRECAVIKQLVQKKISVMDDIELVKYIRGNSKLIQGVNANSENFNFQKLLTDLNIDIPKDVFVNWFRFDKIDKFHFKDLNTCFEYIWYPGPDDIEIFTEQIDWIISIDESGLIFLYK